MGSRALMVVCRDADAARRRFGVDDAAKRGAIYTRTGRPFFTEPPLATLCLRERRPPWMRPACSRTANRLGPARLPRSCPGRSRPRG